MKKHIFEAIKHSKGTSRWIRTLRTKKNERLFSRSLFFPRSRNCLRCGNRSRYQLRDGSRARLHCRNRFRSQRRCRCWPGMPVPSGALVAFMQRARCSFHFPSPGRTHLMRFARRGRTTLCIPFGKLYRSENFSHPFYGTLMQTSHPFRGILIRSDASSSIFAIFYNLFGLLQANRINPVVLLLAKRESLSHSIGSFTGDLLGGQPLLAGICPRCTLRESTLGMPAPRRLCLYRSDRKYDSHQGCN